MSYVKTWSKARLCEYAEENGLDLGGIDEEDTKADILEALDEAIEDQEEAEEEETAQDATHELNKASAAYKALLQGKDPGYKERLDLLGETIKDGLASAKAGDGRRAHACALRASREVRRFKVLVPAD